MATHSSTCNLLSNMSMLQSFGHAVFLSPEHHIRCELETLNILSPIPCTVIGLNGEVENTPQLVNRDAYGDGWLINVRPHDGFDFDDLMTADEYVDYLEEV